MAHSRWAKSSWQKSHDSNENMKIWKFFCTDFCFNTTLQNVVKISTNYAT
jgi:IS30 family transposase